MDANSHRSIPVTWEFEEPQVAGHVLTGEYLAEIYLAAAEADANAARERA
jgi:hypothetical protein